MMIPIDKMSTTDKAIESIRSYIQEPGRNPGEKLPTENELGKQLGVGRSSIREALRVLQTMGYVTIVHGKGAFIKACQPSSEEAERCSSACAGRGCGRQPHSISSEMTRAARQRRSASSRRP